MSATTASTPQPQPGRGGHCSGSASPARIETTPQGALISSRVNAVPRKRSVQKGSGSCISALTKPFSWLNVFVLCYCCFGLSGHLWEPACTTLTRSACADCHPDHFISEPSVGTRFTFQTRSHRRNLPHSGIHNTKTERDRENENLAPNQLKDPRIIHLPLSPRRMQEKKNGKMYKKPCLCYRALLLTGCAN